MTKGLGEGADNGEAQFFSQMHRSFIGRHYTVELHEAKSPGHGFFLGMLTQLRCNAPPAGGFGDNIAAIAYMGPNAG